MNVYVVIRQLYEDVDVIGVFDNKENAISLIEDRKSKQTYNFSYDIEIWKMNGHLQEVI